jgi:gamma-butyrobetaine dioxygenase
LKNHRAIPRVEQEGHVSAIRSNNRSKVIALDFPERLDAFYAAYRASATLLEDLRYSIAFHLEPGDLVLTDNTRILHGRTAFSADGHRHMQGCYADRDGLRGRALPADS